MITRYDEKNVKITRPSPKDLPTTPRCTYFVMGVIRESMGRDVFQALITCVFLKQILKIITEVSLSMKYFFKIQYVNAHSYFFFYNNLNLLKILVSNICFKYYPIFNFINYSKIKCNDINFFF